MAKSKETFLVIDSFALIYRAYYAYPLSLTTSEGAPVNAVYGFSNLLLEVLLKFKPSHVVAVFDTSKPVIRQADFVGYKANRKEMDDDLKVQIPMVKEIVEGFNIPMLGVDGYEADDVIGTLHKKYTDGDKNILIVTGDQDIFQLVEKNTTVYLAGSTFSKSKLYDAKAVEEKLEVRPDQVIDYKAICGDPSDNIPGVKGIGKKGAVNLLQKFGTLENVYDNIEEITGATKTKLVNGYEMAMKSKELATILRDVPILFDIRTSVFKDMSIGTVRGLFEQYRFKSLGKKLDKLIEVFGLNDELSLFSAPESISAKENEMYSSSTKLTGENVALDLELVDSNVNPLHWEVEKIEIADASFVYDLSESDLPNFLERVIKEGKSLVVSQAKELHHILNNKNITNLTRLVIFDIAAGGYIVGGGVVPYRKQEIVEHYTTLKEGDLVQKFLSAKEGIEDAFKVNSKLQELYDLEASLLDVIVKMERNGVVTDVDALDAFTKKLEKVKQKMMVEIYKEVGHEFNINSPKQVGEVLFIERKLEGGKKTKTGAYSTNEQVLRTLKSVDPLVEMILKYREIEKLLSTYVKTLPSYVDTDGRIHAIFDQFGAVSGRFSSRNPNMQNIPNSDHLGVNVRSAFTAPEGSFLVSFDYSQQELRLLAAFAGEQKMIDSFNNDEDIHKVTAAEMFDKPLDEVTKFERGVGKTINFSIVYGISAFGLAERMEIDQASARDFIKKYYEEYPRIREYFDKQKKVVFSQRYAETVLGRTRKIDEIKFGNRFSRQAIEREMLNFSIQGSAADVMKLAMLAINRILDKYPVKLIAQIHDEFLFEYEAGVEKKNIRKFTKEDKEFKSFSEEVRKIMREAYDVGVSYKVDVEVGKRWGEMV